MGEAELSPRESLSTANLCTTAIALQLLRAAIKDVVEARLQINNLSAEVKQRYEKLDRMLLDTGGAEIYSLVELLDSLGFRIAIAPKD